MSNASTLAEKVNEAMKKTDKRQVGYTVSAYAGVLSALQQAGIVQKENEQQQNGLITGTAPTYSVSQRSWTVLGNKDINGADVVENGFFKSELNQAQVSLHSYMSFVVDVDVNGKALRECVNCGIKANDHDGKCINSSGGDLQYPPSEFTIDANKSCKEGTIDNGGFVIGVGVAFEQLVLNYFKHFYSTSEWNVWDIDKLKNLASQRCLFAEVMIPTSKSKGSKVNAKVIHSMVTVNTNTSSETSSYDVYLPIPLLLLNDFNDICDVEVDIVGEQGSSSSVVNNTNSKYVVKFPFSSKKFNHKKSVIEGFTPESVEYYLKSDDSITVKLTHVNYFSDNYEGRIRLYFDREREQDVVKEIGEIPNNFKENLFKGVLNEDGYYRTDNVVEGFGLFESQEIYFPTELAEIISKDKYLKVLSIIRSAEIGTPTPRGAGHVEWNVAGDGAGITYGNYQTTGKSGGLTRLIDLYINDSNSNKKYVDEINLYKSAAKSLIKTDGVEKLMNALKQAGNNDPNMAVMQSKHLYEEQIKNKGLINAFKKSGAKSPLAFSIALHSYNQGRPSNFWTGVAEASSEKEKCNLMIQHELSYIKGFSWWKIGGNHDRWTSDYIKAINNGNFELNQVQRWCNATF